ncbi:MAG TPA: hypothetical protein VMR48_02265 [Gaiellaceae bacterium]|jgi:hypothetical protein|nr:hypothetical protein [Gaiellaceae bacterium]
MKKFSAILAAVVAVAAIGVTAAVSSGDGRTVLKFDTMAPVVPPYTGPANAIRGVNGGGLPWKLASAEGKLRADGRLSIEVEGLVLVGTGANPSPTFRGVVSCLSSDETGAATIVNVSTDAVPATSTGDAEIDARVALPSPCFAPIVFVTSGGGSWFAVTGR